MGKSAIAAQFIQNRRDKNNIAAYHFCIAGSGGTTEPNSVLQSLAAQLMEYFPDDYAEALVNTITPFHLSLSVNITIENIKDSEVQGVVIKKLYASYPQEVLDIVLRKPLNAISLSQTQKHVVILIDSLDEAATYDGKENLVTLLSQVKDLPSWVRFICTTRQQREVLSHLETLKSYIYYLDNNSKQSLNDIRSYINVRLDSQEINDKLHKFNVKSETFLKSLTNKSSGNFMYTKLVLDEIKSGYLPPNQLDTLPKGLYGIYHEMLRRRCSDNQWEEYQPILGTLAVAQIALTKEQLVNFTQNRKLDREKITHNLGKLIQFINESKEDKTYTLFHQSFRDYLLSEDKKTDFYCDKIKQHQEIINYYKKETNFWNYFNQPKIDNYGLLYLPKHLHSAEQKEDLYKLLTNSPKWMDSKFNSFSSDTYYVDDLELAINTLTDTSKPNQLLTLVKLYTARQVVHQRSNKYGDIDLKTLVLIGRETEALNYARLRNDAAAKFYSLLTVHNALQQKDDLDSTILDTVLDEVKEVAELIEKDGMEEQNIQTLGDLAIALTQAEHLREAQEIIDKINNNSVKTGTLIKLALAFANKKDFQQAEVIFEEANKLITETNDSSLKVEALLKFATALIQAGFTEKAKLILKEAKTIPLKTKDIKILSKLAVALTEAGDVEQAKLIFAETEELKNGIENDFEKIEILKELALALTQAQFLEEAKAAFEEAEQIARAIAENSQNVMPLLQVAETLALAKDVNRAIAIFDEGMKIPNAIQGEWNQAAVLRKFGETLFQAGFTNEADNIFTKATHAINGIPGNSLQADELRKWAATFALADVEKAREIFTEAEELAPATEKDSRREQGLSKWAAALSLVGFKEEAHTICSDDLEEQEEQIGLERYFIEKAVKKTDDLINKFSDSTEFEDFLHRGKHESIPNLNKAISLVIAGESIERVKVAAKIEDKTEQEIAQIYLPIIFANKNRFKEAFSTLGMVNIPSQFLENLVYWASPFEKVKPKLSLEILREIIRIFGWQFLDYSEIYISLIQLYPSIPPEDDKKLEAYIQKCVAIFYDNISITMQQNPNIFNKYVTEEIHQRVITSIDRFFSINK